MSATIAPAAPAVVPAIVRGVRVEALKLRTTPALWLTLGLTAAFSVIAAVTAIELAGHSGAAALGTTDNVSHALSVGALTSMVMLVLGILCTAGENRHRTVVGTYLGQPLRERVLVSKLLLIAALGALVGFVSFGIALAVVVPLYSSKGVHHLPVDVTSLWIGSVLVSACYGLLGVALGALTRNTVAAIIGAILWVQAIEVGILQAAVPSLAKWLPTGAGVSLTSAGSDVQDLLAPGVAALVLVGWAAVLCVGASRISVSRDVG
jgi:hypothetical protein